MGTFTDWFVKMQDRRHVQEESMLVVGEEWGMGGGDQRSRRLQMKNEAKTQWILKYC